MAGTRSKAVDGQYRIKIEISFASGHRLLEHNGKCIFPHGHTYKAEIWMGSEGLDRLGFVVDFRELKHRVNGWIEDNWDHAFLANGRDSELLAALGSVKGSRVFVFPDENPSAEVMARELYQRVEELCGAAPLLVRVWESATQCAEFCRHSPEAGLGTVPGYQAEEDG